MKPRQASKLEGYADQVLSWLADLDEQAEVFALCGDHLTARRLRARVATATAAMLDVKAMGEGK